MDRRCAQSWFSGSSCESDREPPLAYGWTPGLPRWIFQVQSRRKPLRCQPMKVEASTMWMPDLQSYQTEQSHAQRKAVRTRQLRAFRGSLQHAIWWRNARISIWRAARLRSQPQRQAMSAAITGPNGIEWSGANLTLTMGLEIARTTISSPVVNASP
jgi:hypothetical protein